ncbi:putative Nitroreductase family protein [Paratrimastix pyriformis]|uniref:Nitroreductase family protein n=1 Tax=Paratrimastix pyriformis TaxID=342808 RepID=A0ABQ8UDK8_9EUKA|nr:putative Nitroreductase family protein [Paratrimastix pyriformis]
MQIEWLVPLVLLSFQRMGFLLNFFLGPAMLGVWASVSILKLRGKIQAARYLLLTLLLVPTALLWMWSRIRQQRRVDSTQKRFGSKTSPSALTDVDIIRMRSSWRHYDASRDLSPDERREIEGLLADDGAMTGPFGLRVRILLVSKAQADGKLGTYGVVTGARDFLVGKVADRGVPSDYADFGYVFERVVLRCTRVFIVSPVGHVPQERGAFDTYMRAAAGSSSRLAWPRIFFRQPAPAQALAPIASEAEAEGLAVPLSCVRTAPSASNKQPWRVVVHAARPAVVSFWRGPAYPMGGEMITNLGHNDLGIAMCHFEAACGAQGMRGGWERAAPEGAVPPEGALGHVATWRQRL